MDDQTYKSKPDPIRSTSDIPGPRSSLKKEAEELGIQTKNRLSRDIKKDIEILKDTQEFARDWQIQKAKQRGNPDPPAPPAIQPAPAVMTPAAILPEAPNKNPLAALPVQEVYFVRDGDIWLGQFVMVGASEVGE